MSEYIKVITQNNQTNWLKNDIVTLLKLNTSMHVGVSLPHITDIEDVVYEPNNTHTVWFKTVGTIKPIRISWVNIIDMEKHMRQLQLHKILTI